MAIITKKKPNIKAVKNLKNEAILGTSKKAAPKPIFKGASIKEIDDFFNSVFKNSN